MTRMAKKLICHCKKAKIIVESDGVRREPRAEEKEEKDCYNTLDDLAPCRPTMKERRVQSITASAELLNELQQEWYGRILIWSILIYF